MLDTELHVIYLVTPLSPGSQIETVNWMTFNELWNTMSESERRVGRLVGVEERFLMSAIRGIVKPGKLVIIVCLVVDETLKLAKHLTLNAKLKQEENGVKVAKNLYYIFALKLFQVLRHKVSRQKT